MKKLFLILFLSLFISTPSFAYQIPKNFNIHKPYISMSFEDAMKKQLPFLLVFASSKKPATFIRFLPIGKMVYLNFAKDFNFSLINVEFPNENGELIEFFQPQTLPAVYIVDPMSLKFLYIDSQYYTSSSLKSILTEYKKGFGEEE